MIVRLQSALALCCVVCLTGCSPSDRSELSAEQISERLETLGLGENQRVSWDSLSVEGQDYIYTQFKIANTDGTELVADELKLTRVSEYEDGLRFKSLSMSGGVITDQNTETVFETFTLIDPGAGLVDAFFAMLNGEETVDIPFADQSFGKVSLSNVNIVLNDPDDVTMSLKFAQADLDNFDGAVLGGMTVQSLLVEQADKFNLTLDLFELNGLNVTMFDSRDSLNMYDTSSSDSVFALFTGIDFYERFNLSNMSITTDILTVSMDVFDSQIVKDKDDQVVITQSLPSLTITPTDISENQFKDGLDMLGYDQLVVMLKSRGVYDKAEDRFYTEGENLIGIENGIILYNEQNVSGISAYNQAYQAWASENAMSDEPPIDEMLSHILIHHMSLTLEDRSLLDRVLNGVAIEQGITPEALKGRAGIMIPLGLTMLSGRVPSADLADLSIALMGFITHGGSLVIEFDPQTPVRADVFYSDDLSLDEDGDVTFNIRHEPAKPE